MNDDYSLVVEMGLEGEKAQFKAIQVRVRSLRQPHELTTTLLYQRDVRDLVHTARLDMKLDYRKQNVSNLGNLFTVVRLNRWMVRASANYEQARDIHPYLARFENDWATADIVKQYLRNRRKYVARQSKQGSKPDRMLSTRNDNGARLGGGDDGTGEADDESVNV